MLEIDNKVVENFTNVMSAYIAKCIKGNKAPAMYSFETVIKLNDMPVAKVKTNMHGSQVLPVGEKER